MTRSPTASTLIRVRSEHRWAALAHVIRIDDRTHPEEVSGDHDRARGAAARWSTLDVETDGLRYNRLDLDGHSVLNAARRMTITCDPDDLPTVEIELRCETYRMHSDRTRVELHMPDDVRDLLIRQGLTPPPGEDA